MPERNQSEMMGEGDGYSVCGIKEIQLHKLFYIHKFYCCNVDLIIGASTVASEIKKIRIFKILY